MKSIKYVLPLVLLLLSSFALGSVKIDPKLYDFAVSRNDLTSTTRVLAVMESSIALASIPKRYDRKNMIQFLKSYANNNWKKIEADLIQSRELGHSIRLVSLHWINSSFTADVTPSGLKMLSKISGIKKIYANRRVFPEDDTTNPPSPQTFPYDLKQIKMDQVMNEFPDLTGKNVILGHLDTGVDGTHPALLNKIQLFYDNEKKKIGPPVDTHGHGTHTAGTILGGNRTDNVFGIAPDTKLVASGPLNSYEGLLNGMEFFAHLADDEGKPNFPHAISNSWNCEQAPDLELFYKAITTWEAVGILPVFSAGNNGPSPKTITKPHEHPAVLAVGSTGENALVSDFSSRGPALYKGQETKKPDLAAPGDNIRSSYPGGGYQSMSGTSMAAPHVTGVTSLVWQVNPKFTPAQVKQILTTTTDAVDINGNPANPGDWNANYGFGKLDVYEAIKLAIRSSEVNNEPNPIGQPFGFVGPEDLKAFAIASMEPEALNPADLQFEEKYDGQAWLTAAQIWK